MKNTIDQCQAAWCACVVICDPHVDRENERPWLPASLAVSCALKGRRTLLISLAVNNKLVIIVLTEEVFFFVVVLFSSLARSVLPVSWLEDALSKGTPRGLGTLWTVPRLKAPSFLLLISRLQSYCNQCSVPAPCGINVTEINFTIFFIFFFIRPPATVISFLSQNLCAPEFNFLLILISWKYKDW